MENTIRPKPASAKARLIRTIQKLVHIQTATRPATGSGGGGSILRLRSHAPALDEGVGDSGAKSAQKRAAVLEAFAAKLFAGVSSVKAAYAELQLAQSPYDGDAIQSADEAAVKELKVLSEMKHGFLRNEFDPCPAHVTLMLSEIQEQQSLTRTYEISIKTLEARLKRRDAETASLRSQLEDCLAHNDSLEKKLNSSGYLDALGDTHVEALNPSHFVQVLRYALKSIRGFVGLMIRGMQAANWDLESAADSIHRGVAYSDPSHCFFAFESFVSREMFEGFNFPNYSIGPESLNQQRAFKRFKALKSENPKSFAAANPKSPFAVFLRAKYLRLVHPKMECSLFGNLRQRNLVNSGDFPGTEFFTAFAEMAKRTWLLHCLAQSYEEGPGIFQVKRNCRFSEVFMECVNAGEAVSTDGTLRTAFTVSPGFKIGKTVVQCHVYMSPSPARVPSK